VCVCVCVCVVCVCVCVRGVCVCDGDRVRVCDKNMAYRYVHAYARALKRKGKWQPEGGEETIYQPTNRATHIFHGGCHTGFGHFEPMRRDTAALLCPLSSMTRMISRCFCAACRAAGCWASPAAMSAAGKGDVYVYVCVSVCVFLQWACACEDSRALSTTALHHQPSPWLPVDEPANANAVLAGCCGLAGAVTMSLPVYPAPPAAPFAPALPP